MPELDQTKRRVTWTVFATLLMTFAIDIDLSIHWDLFPGMGEGETDKTNQGVL